MKTRQSLLLLSFLLSILPGITAHAESALVFENVWIAEAPPVSKVMAAYMTINNPVDKDQKLVSASSDDFSSVEFHRTVYKDGMASMKHQQYLVVPANGTLVLKPGDYHMMLFNPGRKLSAGDESAIQLKLENGNTIKVPAVVKKSSAEDSHHHHHH